MRTVDKIQTKTQNQNQNISPAKLFARLIETRKNPLTATAHGRMTFLATLQCATSQAAGAVSGRTLFLLFDESSCLYVCQGIQLVRYRFVCEAALVLILLSTASRNFHYQQNGSSWDLIAIVSTDRLSLCRTGKWPSLELESKDCRLHFA